MVDVFRKEIFNIKILFYNCCFDTKIHYIFHLNKLYIFFEYPDTFLKIKNSLIYFLNSKGIIYYISDFYFCNSTLCGFNLSVLNFLKFGSRFLININEKSVQLYKLKLKTLIKSYVNKNIFILVNLINNKIKGWLEYSIFCFVIKYSFLELDLYIYKLLWKQVKKFHSKKSNTWIYLKYWKYFSGIWRFFVIDFFSSKVLFLKSHFYFVDYYNSKDIFKISNFLNIFNLFNFKKLNNVLFEKFKYKFLPNFITLYNSQKGLCFVCKRPIYSKNFKFLNVNALLPNFFENLFLAHNYCNIL